MENKRLKNIFKESDCPDADTLLAYSQNALSGKKLHDVEEHLTGCPLCVEALEGFSEINNPAEVNAVLSELDRDFKSRIGNAQQQKAYAIYRMAAILIVLFLSVSALFVFLQKQQDAKMLSENRSLTSDNLSSADTPASTKENLEAVPEKKPAAAETRESEKYKKETSLLAAEKSTFAVTENKESAAGSVMKDAPNRVARETDVELKEELNAKDNITERSAPVFNEDDSRVLDAPAAASQDARIYNRKENIESLSKVKSTAADESIRNEMLETAINYYNTKEYNKALPLLESLVNINDKDREKSRWYLAQTYLAVSDTTKCRETLNTILRSSASPYKKDAEKLIKRLE